MEDISQELEEFDAYLDSMIVHRESLDMGVKDVSKIYRLNKKLYNLNILCDHTPSMVTSLTDFKDSAEGMIEVYKKISPDLIFSSVKSLFAEFTNAIEMRDGLILMADNLTPASDPVTVYKRILEFVYQASVCLFLTDEAGRVTRKNHGEGRIEGLLANLKEGDLPLDIAASTRVFGKEEVDARGGEGRFRRVQVSLLYKAISGTRGYVLVAEEGFSHIHDTILFEMERGSGVAEKLMEIHKGIGKAACDAVDSPSPPSVKDMRDLIVDYTTRYMNLMPVLIRKTFVGAIDSEFHSEV